PNRDATWEVDGPGHRRVRPCELLAVPALGDEQESLQGVVAVAGRDVEVVAEVVAEVVLQGLGLRVWRRRRRGHLGGEANHRAREAGGQGEIAVDDRLG